ncbi:TIGR01440 family protein [Cohnella panacarvi]|uniref:TIGR01440 family protein n=1 Tax=Cohnella panacarvi TaxID=400776 RepID=UPI000554D056|nr:TIGR01440 family protein [Cohnella panacarvi]
MEVSRVTLDARNTIAEQVEQVVSELAQAAALRPGHIVVFGVSTSEVQGARIGTSGTESVAAQIYEGVERVRSRIGFHAVWQCCEHLNRALVTDRGLAEARGWTEVSAVPVPKAGGSMASFAYRKHADPCLVEAVQAHAGVDIGETMIGMHLRRVAVPVRPTIRWIGQARVAMATTRPMLIGGARAVYSLDADAAAGTPSRSNTCD